MILKFESFFNDISEDIKDYFNNICDSGAEIDIEFVNELQLWRVTLEGDTRILEHDKELKFLDQIYLRLRGDDKPNMIENIYLEGEDLKLARENPFFKRIYKASNLLLGDISVYSGGWTFEIAMWFKAI